METLYRHLGIFRFRNEAFVFIRLFYKIQQIYASRLVAQRNIFEFSGWLQEISSLLINWSWRFNCASISYFLI